ncbi:MAG: hypothetical protein B7Y70_13125 [Rhizobiales bacterium 35-68-8]|nr:MAG: hypothetical protein B7Y70_13125 [Rhizobiales bacterium 35-68-8]
MAFTKGSSRLWGLGLGLVMAAAVSTASTAQEVIRIGAPLPLTGPLSPEGVKQQRGYNLWAKAANTKGGITAGGKTYKVEIVYVDYESNTPRAVQSAERLITSDKVNFLFSPFGSGAAKAASSVSERYRIPTIAATASSVEVYDQGYKYLFGTFTPNDTLTNPLADIVSKAGQNVKTIAIYARNDLFPRAIAKEMEKSAKARGIEVVSFDEYAIGTMDHASALTLMLQRKPEALGRRLGKSTGWILKAKLRRAHVAMIAGAEYRAVDDAGLHYVVDGAPHVLDVDHVILCAGQEPERGLYDDLVALGAPARLIGGADVAAELDALRAIGQATHLAVAI